MNRRVPRSAAAALAALILFVAACSAPAAQPASVPATADASTPGTPVGSSGAGATPGASVTAQPSDPPAALDSDPLHAVSFSDVRDGTTYTLGQLAAEKPVLVETMAIWCVNCRGQMHRAVEAHELTDFHSVGIDVDPSERAEDLRFYVKAEGFEWPFTLADAELATMLRERFGNEVLNPPSRPMFLLFPDGSVRALEFGRFGGYTVEELVAEIAAG